MSSKKYDGPSEGTRRSTRVIPKSGTDKISSKKASVTKTSKKRSKAEVESETEGDDTEDEEKPKAKKVH